MKFLQGKKTYLAIGAFVVLATLMLLNVAIPDFVWTLIAAAGLGGIRSGIKDISGNKGWKTYAAVIAAAGLGTLQALGVTLPPDLLTGLYSGLGALGVVGVRDA
ncbi:MAG: hypothetical protein KAR20_29850, partial [Candidatus Heimdallarchaeota archaeon]|nr:hypothetical protein [Candidatus Heimdallarchaeota archaeon]